jgi:hypothetical protein
MEEERKSVVMVVEVTEPSSISRVIDLKDYGTAERLFRVTAWVLNVRAKARGIDRQSGELTVNELVEAESIWIKEAQAGLKVDRKYTQLSNSLGLIEDEGILRCKGRLHNSELEIQA